MIDVSTEQLLTLAQAAQLRPAGRRGRPTHTSTVYRWISRGLRGHRLEAIRLNKSTQQGKVGSTSQGQRV